ncbi:MAG: helix-turn-helix transcriptional regulator, partial [Lachnospiraceae bacterium]|nr:helix-turn-helix transcriptional regulator [Lachnospiraceae bacterium]
ALQDGCKYRINDTVFDLEKDDVLLVWPQQIHGTVKIPKKSSLLVQFPATIIESNLDLVSVSRFLFEFHHISAKVYPELARFIREKIDEIQSIYVSSEHFAETRCKILINQILLMIAEHVMKRNDDFSELEESARLGWRYIHIACNYIVDNVANEITQTEVAEHVGLSTFYFSKLFKQSMRMTFPAYLSRLRVKRATSLLLDKNLSVTDCAFMAGFQSTTTFNKVFREITGYSPREYRKLHR